MPHAVRQPWQLQRRFPVPWLISAAIAPLHHGCKPAFFTVRCRGQQGKGAPQSLTLPRRGGGNTLEPWQQNLCRTVLAFPHAGGKGPTASCSQGKIEPCIALASPCHDDPSPAVAAATHASPLTSRARRSFPSSSQPSRSAPDAHGAAAPAQAESAARPETTHGSGDAPDRTGQAVMPRAPRPCGTCGALPGGAPPGCRLGAPWPAQPPPTACTPLSVQGTPLSVQGTPLSAVIIAARHGWERCDRSALGTRYTQAGGGPWTRCRRLPSRGGHSARAWRRSAPPQVAEPSALWARHAARPARRRQALPPEEEAACEVLDPTPHA